MLRKDAKFKIVKEELVAIGKLKPALVQEPLLKIYERTTTTELHTDASKHGFGAVLLQLIDGQLHPVYFWSKKTSAEVERKHSYILEVKAAYLVFKKFRHYLLGVEFKLVADCAAFKHTISKKDVPNSVAEWIMYMQDFTFTVEHRSGNRLKVADGLSRNPVDVMMVHADLSARLQKAQQADEGLRAIALILSTGPYSDFIMKNGLVYKAVGGNDLLFVSKPMEYEIIKNSHEQGHFSVEKTMHHVQQQFYIPHLERKVSQHTTRSWVKETVF